MKDKTSKIDSMSNDVVILGEGQMPLEKPANDTKFAKESAKFLVDIIKKNHWSKKLGGQSEHIMYEGWQTAGKFYGYTVRTLDAEYVEIGGAQGFKAKAIVVNEKTGIEVGGAEAYCMNDEPNWKSKPKFQLASMAQTRAGSKALRQILGFVVALAGYSATPAEEMDGIVESPKPLKHVGNDKSTQWLEEEKTTPENPTDDSEMVCSDCGKSVNQKVHDYSVEKYGKSLCFTCQKKQ